MRTRVVVQSRLSSSRLPGKALIELGGMPLVELVARRASRSGFEVVVATSVEAYDDRVAQHLDRVGIAVVRGPLDDVLGRFIDATSDMAPEDRVVRLTGDNPVADASLVQEIIDETVASGHDYGRVDIEQVPEGLGVEVFSVASLREADREATAAYDREHVTPWIRRNKGEYLAAPEADYGDPTIYRCTTDCLHDYDRVSRLFDDVDAPVEVDWRKLITRLHYMIRGYGSLATNIGGSKRLTSVLLGTNLVGILDKGRNSVVVREVFAAAVNRGISHTFFRAVDAPVVASGTLPGLRQRLGAMVLLGPSTHSALEVTAELEAAFAQLGTRRAAAVFVPHSSELEASSGWAKLRDYQEQGVVDRLGVFINAADQLSLPLPRRGSVAFDLTTSAIELDQITRLASEGVETFALLPRAVDRRIHHLSRAGVVVVAQPRNVSELESALAAADKA